MSGRTLRSNVAERCPMACGSQGPTFPTSIPFIWQSPDRDPSVGPTQVSLPAGLLCPFLAAFPRRISVLGRAMPADASATSSKS